ncbi:IclR family transcriptional regulator [Rhizobacter sp. Root1221]|uniref:IclR family transcriptional regulator n=1 Tax=Rhizobacter sp. Root1221 TaxID=1736433 RepID=UPI0006F660B8|nr:helix-turn-helix domain-containing protein [Rhizobacter sp. Root1221]KQW00108.1 IclR family transcriptional regulator [Rhizobacter sp. Root1221]
MPKIPADATFVPGDGVAAVDRALAIASALAQSSTTLTLADLARLTGMYKSTLLRLLASLQRSGLVVHRSDRRYALGPLAFLFGRAFDQTYGLRDGVYPVLEWLVTQHTESPSFHVLHGKTTRLCLFRIDSPHATLDRVREGDVLPLDKGAGGRALAAFAQGASAKAPLVFTSHGERDPLCAAIASPVFGPSGLLLGALSLSGPLERFSEHAVQRMSMLLLTAAETATRSLGGRWPGALAPMDRRRA